MTSALVQTRHTVGCQWRTDSLRCRSHNRRQWIYSAPLTVQRQSYWRQCLSMSSTARTNARQRPSVLATDCHPSPPLRPRCASLDSNNRSTEEETDWAASILLVNHIRCGQLSALISHAIRLSALINKYALCSAHLLLYIRLTCPKQVISLCVYFIDDFLWSFLICCLMPSFLRFFLFAYIPLFFLDS